MTWLISASRPRVVVAARPLLWRRYYWRSSGDGGRDGQALLGRDGDDNLATSLVRAACVVWWVLPRLIPKKLFKDFCY
jgi:hypothetical protein